MNSSGSITSGLLSTLDWTTPLWAKKLYAPYGDQGTSMMLDLLAQNQGYDIVGNKTGQWFEDDRTAMFATCNTAVTAAAGANLVFSLPATEQAADGTVYPVVGNLLMHSFLKTQFVITAIVGLAITVRPLSLTGANTFAVGDKFIVFSDTRPEGSDGPDPQYSGVTAYTWNTQIIRTAATFTGSALVDDVKTVSGVNGGKGGSYSKYTRDMEYRNLLYMVGAFMFGAKQTNTGLESFSLGTTDGLDTAIAQRGQNLDTGTTELDETQFYAMTDLLETQGTNTIYQLWGSKKRIDQIEKNFKDYLANTNLSATAQTYAQYAFGSPEKIKGLEATFAFNQITIGGRTFLIRKFGLLSDPRTYNIAGVTGNPFQDLAYCIPMGNASVKDGQGTETFTKHITVKNRSANGVNRYMRVWDTGAMSDRNKTRVDNLTVDCLTDFGYQFAAVNQFGAFR